MWHKNIMNMIDRIRKYNFWDGNVPELGFLRKEYLDKIKASTGNNLVKVLVGQHRAGKSFVLRQVAKQLLDSGVPAQNILYVNTEYLEYGDMKTANDLQALYCEYKKYYSQRGKYICF